MKIVEFAGADTGSPDSSEWHAWRAGGIGGSDAGAIAVEAGLLVDPPKWFKTPHQLWELKAGIKEDSFKGNWATERGRKGEEVIRRLYEKETGIFLSPMFGEMDDTPCVRASFDGISFDFAVIGEIKCPSAAVHAMAKNGEVVPYYKPQIVHQALTAWGDPSEWTNDLESHFISGVPEERDIATVRIRARRMQEYAKRLYEAELSFCAGSPCIWRWVESLGRSLETGQCGAGRGEKAKEEAEAKMLQYILVNKKHPHERGEDWVQ